MGADGGIGIPPLSTALLVKVYVPPGRKAGGISFKIPRTIRGLLPGTRRPLTPPAFAADSIAVHRAVYLGNVYSKSYECCPFAIWISNNPEMPFSAPVPDPGTVMTDILGPF